MQNNNLIWNKYWETGARSRSQYYYSLLASIYRSMVIKPALRYYLKRFFLKKAKLLHAGCGGGQVDQGLQNYFDITALDFSPKALELYKKNNPGNQNLILGDITNLNLTNNSFDGIYNLGVMEHFNSAEINTIFDQFYRLLKPGGYVIMFWPPEFGSSVMLFKFINWLQRIMTRKDPTIFFPPEISRLKSKVSWREELIAHGFKPITSYFNLLDLFTHVIIIAQKK